MPNHTLTLGSLNLNAGTGTKYTIRAMGAGTTFGEPEPIEVAIRSLLQDGVQVTRLSDGNREANLRIEIKGTDSDGLGNGEAALVAQTNRPNLLTYIPADGLAAPCVFEVWTSSLTPIYDDVAETLNDKAVYMLRLVCAPWVRALNKTTVAALVSGGSLTTTLVDACSSLTNWSNTGGTTFGVVSGKVQVSRSSGQGLTLTRSAAISTTTEKYITARIYTNSLDSGTSSLVRCYADGVELVRVAKIGTGGDYKDYTWYCPTSVASTLAFTHANSSLLAVDNINKTNQVPVSGTLRQKDRAFIINGSVRTQGSLSIQHASSALGDGVLCYIYDDLGTGYHPDLRVRRSGGGAVTTDANRISGAYENIVAGANFACDIPVGELPPGNYALLARGAKITTTTARILSWGTYMIAVGGTQLIGPSNYSGTLTLPAGTAGVFETFHIANVVLPTTEHYIGVPTTAIQRVQMSTDLGWNLDEAWLFNLDTGALVWLDAGSAAVQTGVAHNRLWIDSPAIDDPRPGLFTGTVADRSDSFLAEAIKSWAVGKFTPGYTKVFTVTPNALDADVALEYYQRNHTRMTA